MDLHIVTKKTHYVDAYDFARFLSDKRGREIEVIGSDNDTDYSQEVYPPGVGPRWGRRSEEEIQEFLGRDCIDLECGSFGPALQYAADQGWIPYGSYVLRVSW